MIAVVVFFLFLALSFGITAALTALLQWALAAAFSLSVPFWPLFVILAVIMTVFGRSGK